MAAYGTLVSLQNLIEHIQLYHAHHPTFFCEHQMQLKSLHERVTNLQDLLEWCSNNGRTEAQDLESRIVHEATEAEDIIELTIVADILASSEEQILMNPLCFMDVHRVDPITFSEQLQIVIDKMDQMEKEMVKIKEKRKSGDQELSHRLPSASLEYALDVNDDMVGFDSEFNGIMDKLRGHELNLTIISITGMGGSGKSTLARNVYDHKSIMNKFDVRGWIIISQEFKVRERLSRLLKEYEIPHDENDEYHSLGQKLYQHLYGRRFLIVVDDIWSVEDWEKLQLFLPNNGNGSRIILTTRLLNVATDVGSSHVCEVGFLDEDTSWSLLCRKAFPDQTCPSGLQEIGKKISKNCKGLPLSLTVIGGLLGKLEKTRECWEKIAGEINMIVSLEDEERCLKILSLSYSHLPIYLKPCFLYMGIFSEDESIASDSLIDLWITEGFIKPCGASDSSEDVARNYLKDLIQRSLVYVSKTGNNGITSGYSEYLLNGSCIFASVGKMESIRIHDLLRNLALKEAQKEKFLHITKFRDPNFLVSINSERRVGFHSATDFEFLKATLLRTASFAVSSLVARHGPNKLARHALMLAHDTGGCLSELENTLSTATFLRSLISNANLFLRLSPGFRLLRVSMNLNIVYSPEVFFQVINSRNLQICHFQGSKLSSIKLLWNLQVLVVDRLERLVIIPDIPHDPATFQIWEMPLLRKLVMHSFILPDPPRGGVDGKGHDAATNLQVISNILDLKCTEEVLRKISNIQILHLMYADERKNGISYFCLDNLELLHKLHTIGFWFTGNMNWPNRTDLLQNLGLSQSLKILSLGQCGLGWEVLTRKVGSLPHLEELSLFGCYTGEEWNTEEGFFLCLKILRLRTCCNLVTWSTESSHFPCLEQLFLEKIIRLEEIPSDIGEIPTLQSIHLKMCSSSVVESTRIILQEQLRFGNDSIRVLVSENNENEEKPIGEGNEGQDDLEEEKQAHEEQKQKKNKTRSRGFVASAISFLFILGSSYVWHTIKLGGRWRGGADHEVKPKKDNDRRLREGDDSWWLFYDYP